MMRCEGGLTGSDSSSTSVIASEKKTRLGKATLHLLLVLFRTSLTVKNRCIAEEYQYDQLSYEIGPVEKRTRFL